MKSAWDGVLRAALSHASSAEITIRHGAAWYSPRVILFPFPGVVILLLPVAAVGAFVDWGYVRNGGRRAGKREWKWLLLFVLLEFAWIIVLVYRGASTQGISKATVWLALLTFELWEFGRWRTRRNYPREPPHIV